MLTKSRMTLAVVTAACLATATALAHEPTKKPAESKPHAMSGQGHSMAGMSEGSKALHQAMMSGMHMPMSMTGNVDTDFATMMTMHHQQAIRMADVLIKYGKNAELRALAQKMRSDQQEEIRQMAPYVAPAKK